MHSLYFIHTIKGKNGIIFSYNPPFVPFCRFFLTSFEFRTLANILVLVLLLLCLPGYEFCTRDANAANEEGPLL